MIKTYLAFLLFIVIVFYACAGETEDFGTTAEPTNSESIKICSFNIRFLGHYKSRDDAALAEILVLPQGSVVT